ncbi:hypothetical protein B0I75DRAFT_18449 [Yarrowia lipolytica]|nr:hypothetical protein B0I74DRAFT_19736 [Yarrowia lipolytica]RDW49595.1 hypothetical protein B0I75DRAFT_18449 [Yarrowia lipolytica]
MRGNMTRPRQDRDKTKTTKTKPRRPVETTPKCLVQNGLREEHQGSKKLTVKHKAKHQRLHKAKKTTTQASRFCFSAESGVMFPPVMRAKVHLGLGGSVVSTLCGVGYVFAETLWCSIVHEKTKYFVHRVPNKGLRRRQLFCVFFGIVRAAGVCCVDVSRMMRNTKKQR